MIARTKVFFSALAIILITILLGFAVPSHAVGNSGKAWSTITLAPQQSSSAEKDNDGENWRKGLTFEEEQWLLYTHEKMRTEVSLPTLRVLAERATGMNLDIDDNTPVPLLDVNKSKNIYQRYGIFQIENPEWSPMCVKIMKTTLCKDKNKNGVADNKDIDTYTDFAAHMLDRTYYEGKNIKLRSSAPTRIMNSISDDKMLVMISDSKLKGVKSYSLQSDYLDEIDDMLEKYS